MNDQSHYQILKKNPKLIENYLNKHRKTLAPKYIKCCKRMLKIFKKKQ